MYFMPYCFLLQTTTHTLLYINNVHEANEISEKDTNRSLKCTYAIGDLLGSLGHIKATVKEKKTSPQCAHLVVSSSSPRSLVQRGQIKIKINNTKCIGPYYNIIIDTFL